MLIGLLMILLPIVVFLGTLPMSRRLPRGSRILYRGLGGAIVFVGSGASLYFAFYGGDQGGIAAYFLQMLVIVMYVALSSVLLVAYWLSHRRHK